MTDLVERLREMASIKTSALYHQRKTLNAAADEIGRLIAALEDARGKALEEAAAYHDDLEAQHAAAHSNVVSDHHMMMERQHRRFAAAIRALVKP